MKHQYAHYKFRKILMALLCAFVSLSYVALNGICEEPAYAATVQPYAVKNTTGYGGPETVLVRTSGGYSRVFSDDKKVYVEDYDDSFNIIKRREIPLELKYYGGFFAGRNAYYFAFGQQNAAENDAAEVIRVVKYDKNWKRVGAAKLTGGSDFAHDVGIPFDLDYPHFAELNGMLYMVCGHEGYVDPRYGQGHQGFLMYQINESSMKGSIVAADLWHSFSQHISIKNANNIFVFEESEGDRCSKLTKYTTSNFYGTSIPVLEYGGKSTSAWAIPTYASADDVDYSSNNVLAIGASIDQSRYDDDSYKRTYNIYLTVTPINNFTKEATTVKWLTNRNLANGYEGVKLTKINDNKFLVTWGEYGEKGKPSNGSYSGLSTKVLHYQFIDGQGNKIGKEYKVSGAFSDCDPIIVGNKAVFYASDAGSVAFYSIDTGSGAISRKESLVAGPSASWSYDNGVVTISGSGAISSNLAENGFSTIEDKVRKIIIRSGITSISEEAFNYLNNLQEVVIEDGLTSIKDKAFYGNYNLKKITIPDSVKSIGSEVFNTGYWWVGSKEPVINVTVYCTKGSYAHKFAKKNGINFVLPAAGARGSALKDAEKKIIGMKKDGDAKYSTYSELQLKSTSNSFKSIRLSWKKVKGAKKYVIYANRCGNANRLKKLKTVKKPGFNVKKVNKIRLAKDTYYKFVVVAVDANNKVISTSKTIHVATSDSRAGNHKSVTTKARKNNVSIKKGKSFKLNAKATAAKKNLKVRKHTVIRYESTDKTIASVSNKGIIKGKKKGTCYVYAYAQNGVCARIRVKVK